MKKNQIVSFLCGLLFASNLCSAQDKAESKATRNGFRIHSMYVGLVLNKPVGGLREIVPSAGAGFKFGSIFYFYRPGIAKGMFNVGLQTQWLNLEANVPVARLNEDSPAYSIAAAANLGPVVSFKPNNDMQVDLFYMLGTGFRTFPNQNKKIYASYVNPENPQTRFSQSVGLAFHYKALYAGLGLQMLNYNYGHFNTSDQLTQRRKFTSFQFTVGVCGWRTKKH